MSEPGLETVTVGFRTGSGSVMISPSQVFYRASLAIPSEH